MRPQARLDRLAQAIPCPACANEPGKVVYLWIDEDAPWPTSEADGAEVQCEMCRARSNRRVVHIGWKRPGTNSEQQQPAWLTPRQSVAHNEWVGNG